MRQTPRRLTGDEWQTLESSDLETREWRLLELAKSESLNVALGVLGNPGASEAVLRRLAEYRPELILSIASAKNAPPEVIEAVPMNDIGAQLNYYMWRIGADLELWRRVRTAQDTHPEPGGPTLGEVTRDYRLRHEQDEAAHRQATVRWYAQKEEWRKFSLLTAEVTCPSTPTERLLEIARDESMEYASAVLQLDPPPPEVLAALIETHAELAEEAARFTDPPLGSPETPPIPRERCTDGRGDP